jgi:hypothetical protein
MPFGACADTPFAGDANYMTMYLVHPQLNYVCGDMYGVDCDMTGYAAGVVGKVQGWAATALANGKTMRLEEAGAPPHEPIGCNPPPNDAQSYEQSGWTGYANSGNTHDVYLQSITAFASAMGMTGMTIFCNEWMMYVTPDPLNASCTLWSKLGPTSSPVGHYPAGTLPYLGVTSQWASSPSLQGSHYITLGAWPPGGPVSLQGKASTTGRTSFSGPSGTSFLRVSAPGRKPLRHRKPKVRSPQRPIA